MTPLAIEIGGAPRSRFVDGLNVWRRILSGACPLPHWLRSAVCLTLLAAGAIWLARRYGGNAYVNRRISTLSVMLVLLGNGQDETPRQPFNLLRTIRGLERLHDARRQDIAGKLTKRNPDRTL